MNPLISIIIPNYNGGTTLGACLDAVFKYKDSACEVTVVDDCSDDASRDIVARYPCRLVCLPERKGTSAARNAGARVSTGTVFFFIDADCLLKEDTIPAIRRQLSTPRPHLIIGGTYTPKPADPGFFSFYQSAFINYFETKNMSRPDYIATHAMLIYADIFRSSGGFREDFPLPILEDVELTHRLRSAGYTLMVDPGIQVRHIFNFTLLRSLRNAARKTEYWLIYSLMNKDLFADSGTASRETKMTGTLWLVFAAAVLTSLLVGRPGLMLSAGCFAGAGLFVNRRLFLAFHRAGGLLFALRAAAYHLFVYPAAIWLGTARGLFRYVRMRAQHPAAVRTR